MPEISRKEPINLTINAHYKVEKERDGEDLTGLVLRVYVSTPQEALARYRVTHPELRPPKLPMDKYRRVVCEQVMNAFGMVFDRENLRDLEAEVAVIALSPYEPDTPERCTQIPTLRLRTNWEGFCRALERGDDAEEIVDLLIASQQAPDGPAAGAASEGPEEPAWKRIKRERARRD